MTAIRTRLTYANVVSTLALFLVLAGGAAVAAKKVPRKSVGPSQLKANAVTTAKIKANAVTTRKIKRNAVTNAKIRDEAVNGFKIADSSVTGADIDDSTTPFARVVHRARGNSSLALDVEPKLYPLGNANYTQGAKESNIFIGAVDVTFSAACAAPRNVVARVVLDSADPLKAGASEVLLFGNLEDTQGGTLNARVELGPQLNAATTRFEPGGPRNHVLSLVASGECAAGGGISVKFGGVNVIGIE